MTYYEPQRKSLPLKNFFRRLFGISVLKTASQIDKIEISPSGIIHDISNPLTVISLAIEELKSYEALMNSEARRHINTAFRASRKMRLFLSHIRKEISGGGEKSLFDASKEICMAIKLFRPIVKINKVKIKYRFNRAIFISGDQTKFFRIASNIISNAIDSYSHFPKNVNKLVVVKLFRTKKETILSIRDFGCGIPKHFHKKIFEPFYTTKQKHAGIAGLGLSIVKKIVEDEFRGKIKLESAPGHGTLFKITIPRMAKE